VAVRGLAGDPPLLPRGPRLPQEGALRPTQLPAEHGARRRGVDGLLQGALLQQEPPRQKGTSVTANDLTTITKKPAGVSVCKVFAYVRHRLSFVHPPARSTSHSGGA